MTKIIQFVTDVDGIRIPITRDTGENFSKLVVDNTDDYEREYIPDNAEEFYEDFGYLLHPWKRDAKKRPVPVVKMTPYQLAFWTPQKNMVMLKCNKAGVSTTSHLEMFWSRLQPNEAGFDSLLIAQNQKIANMHLLDLKKLVSQSAKYNKYMIRRPDVELFKEEKTKLEVMYIRNPYKPSRPSRIIALGSSVGSGFSWKHINRIHMSDVSMIKRIEETEFFSALYSRLANTNGIIKIESIPGEKRGEFYRIWKRSQGDKTFSGLPEESLAEDTADLSSTFTPIKITYIDAMREGVISEDYINKAKRDLGPIEFARIFEAQFAEDSAQWYDEDWFKTGNYTDVDFIE